MQDGFYPESSGQTSGNGTKKHQRASVPANVPEDGLFAALYEERIVGYHPLVSRALRLSEDVPKRLKDKHLERATIYLSNLLYWTPRSQRDGWIYKSVEEINAETDLTRHSQDGARELLRAAGVLQESRQREIYYRVNWGGLKSLLRLATQDGHVEQDRGEKEEGDQDGHVQRSHQDGHVQRGTKTDMSSEDEDGHVQQPSVSTTQYLHPAREHQSIDAREANAGEDEARPGEEATVVDGLIDGYRGEEGNPPENSSCANSSETTPLANGTTSATSSGSAPSESTTSERGDAQQKDGNEEAGKEAEVPAPASLALPGSSWDRLHLKIRREMESISGADVTEEARALAGALAVALEREQADAGLVRVAEYAARHNVPELLGEVVGRCREEIRYPVPFFSTGLAHAIKDEEPAPRTPRPESLVQRFEAALGRRAAKASPSAGQGHTAPGEGGKDVPDSRLTLAGSHAPTVYGIRDASVQRDPGDYFRRGGSEGRAQRERERREAKAKKAVETMAETDEGNADCPEKHASSGENAEDSEDSLPCAGETGYFIDGRAAHERRKRLEAEQEEVAHKP